MQGDQGTVAKGGEVEGEEQEKDVAVEAGEALKGEEGTNETGGPDVADEEPSAKLPSAVEHLHANRPLFGPLPRVFSSKRRDQHSLLRPETVESLFIMCV